MSLARKHMQKTRAKQGAKHIDDGGADATQYELMLMQLANHKRQLKEIQSVERKIELKRQILPEYQPYVDGVLEGGAGAQDDVLMTVMVWHIDAGDIPAALPIARYALQHGLTTPEQYKRDTATLVAEEVAENPEAALEHLEQVLEMTADADMPDEVRAKLHKSIGAQLTSAGPEFNEEALSHYQRALQLHDRVGVKKDIERLERELRKAAD